MTYGIEFSWERVGNVSSSLKGSLEKMQLRTESWFAGIVEDEHCSVQDLVSTLL